MDDEQLKQVMGFIKSAVDTAEERFGQPIMAELHTIKGEVDYLKIKVSGFERDLTMTKKMVEEIHKEAVEGINTRKDMPRLPIPGTRGTKMPWKRSPGCSARPPASPSTACWKGWTGPL